MSIGKTIRVGIMPLERVRDYTLAVANGTYKRKQTEPKIWFASIKSFAAVLSDQNRELLRIIYDNKPESIAELEQMTGRKASNLSRTLHDELRIGTFGTRTTRTWTTCREARGRRSLRQSHLGYRHRRQTRVASGRSQATYRRLTPQRECTLTRAYYPATAICASSKMARKRYRDLMKARRT